MIPERIGPYQILEKIGSGGMGNVYLGKESQTGQVAAVKVLSASLARETGFRDRFHREIEAMKKLQNAHIVTLYGSGSEGENYYYSMEYVPGETLMSLLRREKRLPWRRACEIAIDVCQALKAAHDAGIIHRDLKPSNLLVTPEGFVKLTDFGVAQVFASDRLTVTGGIIGTAEYMSPEQAEGKRAGKQSDLYSLGAVMYAMVTGRTPFVGNTAVEVIQKHKFGVFDPPRLYVPDLPQRVNDTICRLLEKDPQKRFPDALVLLRHLEQTVRLEDYVTADETLVPPVGEDAGLGETPSSKPGQSNVAATPSPGPATLMQSLMKAELSEVMQGGILTAFFNNTFVLLALLVLLIAGGIWLARKPNDLESDDSAMASKSEAIRLMQLARHYRKVGDPRKSERILAALSSVLEENDEFSELQTEVQKSLARVRRDLPADNHDRDQMLEFALKRAERLENSGNKLNAIEIWRSIVELYKGDTSAARYVEQAEQALGGTAHAH
ncbi:MAG: serine/threonine protein kinase [Planctomycetes bacterium]|nr:serine/threonine protein kinase [Planctomycetota bacterium]